MAILTAMFWPRQARLSRTESPQPPPGVLWVSHPREVHGIDPGGVTAVVAKAALKRVWADQFKRWPDLRQVTVEEGVEAIDVAAFFGCPRLETVSLPDSLKHVAGYAFGDCFALREVRFGSGLLDVGQAAFGGCSNLLHVYYGGDAPQARGTRIYVRTPTNLVDLLLGRIFPVGKYLGTLLAFLAYFFRDDRSPHGLIYREDGMGSSLTGSVFFSI